MECIEININVLWFFNLPRRWHLNSLVVVAHRSLKHKIDRATVFHDIVQYIRALNVCGDNNAKRRMLRNLKKRLHYYIDTHLQRVVSPLEFDLPPPLAQVRQAPEAFGDDVRELLGHDGSPVTAGIAKSLDCPFE
jgi:hypothetical protein